MIKKIRLLHPHTHANKTYQSGVTLEVSAIVADWLVEQKIGEYVNQKSLTKKPDTTAEAKGAASSDAVGEA